MEQIEKKYILIVDDQEVNRFILKQIFQDKYNILEASNGIEALGMVEKHQKNIAVIMLDYIMPYMDGFAVLKELNNKNYTRFIPVVMITSDQSAEIESKGLDEGASDFITNPFQPDIVLKRVQNIIDLYDHKNNLEKFVSMQTIKIRKQSMKANEINSNIAEILISVVEYRNLDSGNNIKNFKKLTMTLAKQLMEDFPEYGLTNEKIELIAAAAPLHDIGKIAIPDKILLKPDRLSEDEFDIMKSHTTKGCEILNMFTSIDDKEFYQYCYDVCRSHHEKYDGKGYPDNLKGDEIPISAQIVSMSDAFVALTSDRVYKKKYTMDKAYKMIINGECGVFNPKLLKCFIKLKDDFFNGKKF